jgi:signal transduction histidine kinase
MDRDPDLPPVQRLAAHRFTPAQLVAMDVATVACIITLFGFLVSSQSPRNPGTAWDTVGWVAYFAAAGVTLLRRRLPRTTLAFVLPVAVLDLCLRPGGGSTFYPGGGSAFYVAMALYCVVAVSPRRTALAVAGLATGVVVAATVIGGGKVVPSIIGGVMVMALGWLAGENTRSGRMYADQQAERAAEKAAAAAAQRAEQVRRALADERAQIARELHDIVAHAMSVIAVRSGVARMVIDSDPDQAREALAIIETTTRRSLREMRLLVGVLRDDENPRAELSPAPGLGDLDRLLADTAAAGIDIEVNIDGAVRALPPAADLSAYRIVQEALTNIVRHAGPTRAWLQISYRPDAVSIEVLDEGPRGQAPPTASRAGGGHGLIGMRERTALFGGELTAEPIADGFRVWASLPTAELRVGDVRVSDGAR